MLTLSIGRLDKCAEKVATILSPDAVCVGLSHNGGNEGTSQGPPSGGEYALVIRDSSSGAKGAPWDDKAWQVWQLST
jgi:hypothetical protein